MPPPVATPAPAADIGNEITANYIASLRHQPAPQLSPQPAPAGRRPVELGNISSQVTGDRWTLVQGKPDPSGGHSGANGAAAAAAVAPAASGAGSATTPGRGGGSHGGSGGGGGGSAVTAVAAAAEELRWGSGFDAGAAAAAEACGSRGARQCDLPRWRGAGAGAGCGPSSLQERVAGGCASWGGLPPAGAPAEALDEDAWGSVGRGSSGTHSSGDGSYGGGRRAGKRTLGEGLTDGAAASPLAKTSRFD